MPSKKEFAIPRKPVPPAPRPSPQPPAQNGVGSGYEDAGAYIDHSHILNFTECPYHSYTPDDVPQTPANTPLYGVSRPSTPVHSNALTPQKLPGIDEQLLKINGQRKFRRLPTLTPKPVNPQVKTALKKLIINAVDELSQESIHEPVPETEDDDHSDYAPLSPSPPASNLRKRRHATSTKPAVKQVAKPRVRKRGGPKSRPGMSQAERDRHGGENARLIDEASGFNTLRQDPATAFLFNEHDGEEEDWVTDQEGQPVIKLPKGLELPKGLGVTKEGKIVDANGRVVGRKLVPWHKQRMWEKFLLALLYELHRRGHEIPWDQVVHRLNPGSSGQSAQQALNKLRDLMVTEGHLVPPLLGKVANYSDVEIRGYVRDMTSENPHDVRVVTWGENLEHRAESLKLDGLIRGSGNYRKSTGGQGMDKSVKSAKGNEPRRSRLPKDLFNDMKSRSNQRKDGRKAPKKTDDYDDEEFDETSEPVSKRVKSHYDLRRRPQKAPITGALFNDSEDDGDADVDDEYIPALVAPANNGAREFARNVSAMIGTPKNSNAYANSASFCANSSGQSWNGTPMTGSTLAGNNYSSPIDYVGLLSGSSHYVDGGFGASALDHDGADYLSTYNQATTGHPTWSNTAYNGGYQTDQSYNAGVSNIRSGSDLYGTNFASAPTQGSAHQSDWPTSYETSDFYGIARDVAPRTAPIAAPVAAPNPFASAQQFFGPPTLLKPSSNNAAGFMPEPTSIFDGASNNYIAVGTGYNVQGQVDYVSPAPDSFVLPLTGMAAQSYGNLRQNTPTQSYQHHGFVQPDNLHYGEPIPHVAAPKAYNFTGHGVQYSAQNSGNGAFALDGCADIPQAPNDNYDGQVELNTTNFQENGESVEDLLDVLDVMDIQFINNIEKAETSEPSFYPEAPSWN